MLPTREGWLRPLSLSQGCWLTPQAHKNAMLVQAQFQPRADDIILATYPKGLTMRYWKQSVIEHDRILFLKYDEMMADPTKHVKMLAEFLRVPFTSEEERANVPEEVVRLCSFDNLKGLHSAGRSDRVGGLPMDNFFRSGKVGDWRNHLTEEMATKLDRIVEKKLKGSGLAF
ncbi:hypothetical protein EJB05_55512, partial [Eragrostis curvula]